MQGIEKDQLDQVIVQTYTYLSKAIATQGKTAMELNSSALVALVELRREVSADERDNG